MRVARIRAAREPRAAASEIVESLVRGLARDHAASARGTCACQRALDDAVDTPASAVRAEVRARYGPLLARFFGARGA